jgi:hypothetical protein
MISERLHVLIKELKKGLGSSIITLQGFIKFSWV